MPFSGIFPFSEFLKSPLAKDITFAGSSYKCVMLKDYAGELNAENYRLFVHVTTATASLIAENATVTIGGVDYFVTYKEETAYGSVRLFLSLADHAPEEISLGPELFPALNAAGWSFTGGANNTGGKITIPAETLHTPKTAIYNGFISLDELSVYRLKVVIDQLPDGELNLVDYNTNQSNFSFFFPVPGEHEVFFEARYYYAGYVGLKGVNNTDDIMVSSVSLKKVL